VSFDLLTLVPALLLLWFPTSGMLSQKVQLRTWESFQILHSAKTVRPWWWVPALWIDPGRGAAGVYLLKKSLGLQVTFWSQTPHTEYYVMICVLLVGVMAQLYSRREEGVMLAPMGYVLGVVVMLLPWTVAIAGVVLAITGLFAFRYYEAFFLGGALGVAILGALLRMEWVWWVPAVAVSVLPLIATLVTGKSMELPTRDPTDL
jgi:hypothetical protein